MVPRLLLGLGGLLWCSPWVRSVSTRLHQSMQELRYAWFLLENNTPASFSLVRSKEQRLVRDVFFISQEALGIVYVIDEENVLL